MVCSKFWLMAQYAPSKKFENIEHFIFRSAADGIAGIIHFPCYWLEMKRMAKWDSTSTPNQKNPSSLISLICLAGLWIVTPFRGSQLTLGWTRKYPVNSIGLTTLFPWLQQKAYLGSATKLIKTYVLLKF